MRIKDENYWSDLFRIDVCYHDMYLNSASNISKKNLGWLISNVKRHNDNRLRK